MADSKRTGTSAPAGKPSEPGTWQAFKRALISSENWFAFAMRWGLLGVLGTLIAGYFQYLSAYQDKVATEAKEDLLAATNTFAEVSNALSIPLSLQERVIFGFVDAVEAKVDTEDGAYVTQNARAINAAYEQAYTTFRQNYDLLARKMEIYVDWPSDTFRDAANAASPLADPINISVLGSHNFDCDRDMPFANGDVLRIQDDSGGFLHVDWRSAKHHVFTIEFCFNQIREDALTARQWASKTPIEQAEKDRFIRRYHAHLKERLNKQVVRLNDFMSVAMSEIDRIRVKYRPNGFSCHVPLVREAIGQMCTPVRMAQ